VSFHRALLLKALSPPPLSADTNIQIATIFNRLKTVPYHPYQKMVYDKYSTSMRESLDLPNLPEYVSIKDAAKLLGVSDKRVYAYIEDGRLPAVRAAHVIMIPIEEVKRFKPKISGRPRKNTPTWRTSPENNQLLTTSISVSVKPDQYKKLQRLLEGFKQLDEHVFPGTIAPYIITSKSHPENIEILLIWRNTTLPDDPTHEQAIGEFRRESASVLDWNSARYGRVTTNGGRGQ
jgi:excisionase family DNA binding protein